MIACCACRINDAKALTKLLLVDHMGKYSLCHRRSANVAYVVIRFLATTACDPQVE